MTPVSCSGAHMMTRSLRGRGFTGPRRMLRAGNVIGRSCYRCVNGTGPEPALLVFGRVQTGRDGALRRRRRAATPRARPGGGAGRVGRHPAGLHDRPPAGLRARLADRAGGPRRARQLRLRLLQLQGRPRRRRRPHGVRRGGGLQRHLRLRPRLLHAGLRRDGHPALRLLGAHGRRARRAAHPVLLHRLPPVGRRLAGLHRRSGRRWSRSPSAAR